MGWFRAGLVLATIGLMLIVAVPLQVIFLRLSPRLAARFPMLFHKTLLLLLGVRLMVSGRESDQRPLLVVSNHVSWLDIIVLGSVAPLSFIAKSEMRSWPLFGFLATLQRTVFVQRDARRDALNQASEIGERMAARETMVLFPEGTTGDGNAVLPFKSALFEAAKIALAASGVEQAAVQPVAICYSRLHGLPIGRAERPHVAWPGEVGLLEHVLPLIRAGGLDADIRFGKAIPFDAMVHRKAVSAEARFAIRMLSSST